MKVRVSLVLDLPDFENTGNPVDLDEECSPGRTWRQAFTIQEIHDSFTQYAIVSHLEDAMEWLATSKEDEDTTAYRIYQIHKNWADTLKQAKPTVQYEFLDSDDETPPPIESDPV